MAARLHRVATGAARAAPQPVQAAAPPLRPFRLAEGLSSVPVAMAKAQEGPRTAVLPRLEVAPTNDPLESEADAVAARVMALRSPAPVSQSPTQVARCSACSGGDDDAVQRRPEKMAGDKDDEKHKVKMSAEGTSVATGPAATGIDASASDLTSGGSSMPEATRSFFQERMGQDFSDVRLHKGQQSDRFNQSIGARAFAYRNHVWLGPNEGTAPGFTLAHELTHVMQQAAVPAARRRVLRLTHGPTTPTNCHNWRIPLPPWIAGTMAHLQTATFFAANPGTAGRIIPEVTMPRGTKALMGTPMPPAGVPPGFIDLVGVSGGGVEIGEIKSTASAALATPEAAHYLVRHAEWMARAPFTDTLDVNYNAAIGGMKPGALMSGLASVTGSGTVVGPFMGDPLKTLNVEADTSGAICYWCTGVGSTNPAWALVLQKIAKAVIDAFWDAYRTVMDKIKDVIDWISKNPALAFLILLCLLVIGLALAVIGGLLELPSLGTSTPVTVGGLLIMLGAGVLMLGILGIDTGGFGPASKAMASSLNTMAASDDGKGASYELTADIGGWNSSKTSTNSAAVDFETATTNFLNEAGALPEKILAQATGVFNPFSDIKAPTPTAETLAEASKIADILADNTDTRVAGLGKDAQNIASKVTV